MTDQNSELDEFLEGSNYSHVVSLPVGVLKRYDAFLAQMYDIRRQRLKALVFREQLLAFAFIITAVATVVTIGVALVLLSMNHPKYIVLIPFATTCLAALAVLLKQFQLQTQRRSGDLTQDIRAEDLIRSAIAAYLDSKDTVSDRQAVEQLMGALVALQAAQATGRMSITEMDFDDKPVGHREENPLTWDPISVFLGAS